MGTPYLGELKIVGFGFAPRGWALCNGQLLPINQNAALFSILGTTYGGDGRTTFALPNLQARIPFHVGSGFTLGQAGGETTHTLISAELPAHSHAPAASSAAASSTALSGNLWAGLPAVQYTGVTTQALNTQAIGPVGGSQPHENLPPILGLFIVIALQGIFPTQN